MDAKEKAELIANSKISGPRRRKVCFVPCFFSRPPEGVDLQPQVIARCFLPDGHVGDHMCEHPETGKPVTFREPIENQDLKS